MADRRLIRGDIEGATLWNELAAEHAASGIRHRRPGRSDPHGRDSDPAGGQAVDADEEEKE